MPDLAPKPPSTSGPYYARISPKITLHPSGSQDAKFNPKPPSTAVTPTMPDLAPKSPSTPVAPIMPDLTPKSPSTPMAPMMPNLTPNHPPPQWPLLCKI